MCPKKSIFTLFPWDVIQIHTNTLQTLLVLQRSKPTELALQLLVLQHPHDPQVAGGSSHVHDLYLASLLATGDERLDCLIAYILGTQLQHGAREALSDTLA